MNPLNHVAIIMDGNGRWGLKNKKTRNEGHKEGLKTLEIIINESIKKKIKYLTIFAFSLDNWKRPKKEINYLFFLLENFLENKVNKLNEKNIKIKFIGKKLPSRKLNNLIKTTELKTKNNDKIQLNIAINYGSKEEILNSIRLVVKLRKKVNFKNLENHFYTKNIPDPDILIRTGNKKRLSNFLLWQLSYSEIFFKKKLWPDFNARDYNKIINDYKKIKRNFGSI